MSDLPTRAALALALLCAAPLPAPAAPAALAQLPPGHWYEVPHSRIDKVAYRWPPGIKYTVNNVGFRAVIENWSGGSYDSRRDRLVVWGGGHYAYAGNEIYAFDVKRLAWERVNDPSLAVDLDYRAGDDVYADGTPRSAHSYGNVLYVPDIDRFCSFGTTANFPAARSGTKSWCFDFERRRWERRAPVPTVGYGSSCAWDPVDRKVWCRMNGPGATLVSWDPAADRWETRSAVLEHKTWYDHSGAIDPIRRRYVAVGGGRVHVYDIDAAGRIAQKRVETRGPQRIVAAGNPGFEYDPVMDRFVAWSGGAEVYTLDPETFEWRALPPAAGNRATPTGPSRTGTYGRFRYMPSFNAYIVVSGAEEPVFFYRASDLAAAPVPAALAKAARSPDPALSRWAAAQIARFRAAERRGTAVAAPQGVTGLVDRPHPPS